RSLAASGPAPDTRSFPTRRSSDLKDAHAFTVGFRGGQTSVPAIAAIALAASDQVVRFFESDGALVIQPQPVRYFESPMKQPLPEDRKSTRLNSSHVSISYAVFCL